MEEEQLGDLIGGGRKGFQVLYDQYHIRIYNTALGFLKNPEDAEEVMQDVFVKIYKAAHSFNNKSSIGTWVYRITVNLCLDFLRKRNSKKRQGSMTHISDTFFKGIEDFNHPGVLLENKERATILFHFIEGLPENQKVSFILSYVEGLPRQEVADVMDLSLKATESLLQRAKQNLRVKLEKYFPTYQRIQNKKTSK